MTVTATRGCKDKRRIAVMYIPEFWCGVAATIIVEVVIVAIAAAVDSRKKKK